MFKASIDATGVPLTDEALTAAKNANAVILGAIGGPVNSPSLFHDFTDNSFPEMGHRSGPT